MRWNPGSFSCTLNVCRLSHKRGSHYSLPVSRRTSALFFDVSCADPGEGMIDAPPRRIRGYAEVLLETGVAEAAGDAAGTTVCAGGAASGIEAA
jgi:hypothetical protein